MRLHVYSDGGARHNPGPGAIGVLICDAADEELMRHSDVIGEVTNNIAEYCALIAALELAHSFESDETVCFLDSELVFRQLTGVYRVKDDRMQRLFAKVKDAERRFKRIEYRHVPRTHEKIKIADRLVNEALNEQERNARR